MRAKRPHAKKRKKSFFLRVGVIALAVYLLVMLGQFQLELREKQKELEEYNRKIEAQIQLNEQLRDEYEHYEKYLEEQAYAQGYARPGEIIFEEYSGIG